MRWEHRGDLYPKRLYYLFTVVGELLSLILCPFSGIVKPVPSAKYLYVALTT